MAGRFSVSTPTRASNEMPVAQRRWPTSPKAMAGGAIAIGTTPLGAVALGVLAAGVFAVAAVALRHLLIGRRRVGTLVVDDLTVNRLIVRRPPATLDEVFEPVRQGGSYKPRVNGAQRRAASNLRPGDDVAEGTAGTGEQTCPVCGGSGLIDTQRCENCEGSGKITQGIGGGF